ncbi:MAG TPA: DnaJ domain-containing protein [Candidatus Angelobacter sp.]|nr:DnaJ domain-containing protein [Candidatus Angelobacter sp.]
MLQSEQDRDAYRVLQVDPCAEAGVIQAAYRALARRFHPDGDQPDAARMAALNGAHALLRDPEARRRYDLEREAARTRPIPVAPPVRERVDAWTPRRDTDDRIVLDFGRYMGWSIRDLARHDPDYLRWLCRHSSGLRFRDAIARVLPREPDLDRRAKGVA